MRNQVDIVELSNRVAAYEATGEEILRRLGEISTDIREVKQDLKTQVVEHAALKTAVALTDDKTVKLESRLNNIMGALGALVLAIVTGGFTLAAKIFTK